MKKRKIIFIVSLFLLMLTSFRLVWIFANLHPEFPTVKEGVLDLRGIRLSDDEVLPLNGEWSFFPGKFIVPSHTDNLLSEKGKTWSTVPGDWSSALANDDYSPLGYGTYHLRILLNKEQESPYRIHFIDINTAATVYINGEKVGESGHPSENKDQSIPKNSFWDVSIPSHQKEIDMIIHVSNYEYSKSGGIIKPIRFGTDAAVMKEQRITFSLQFMMTMVLVLHGVYVFCIYLIFYRRRELLYLSVSFLFMAVATVVDDDKILLYLLPSVSYEWGIKLRIIAYLASGSFLAQFVKHFLSEYKRWHPILYVYNSICFVYVLCVACFPLHFYYLMDISTFLFIMNVPVILVLLVILKIVSSGKSNSIYLFLSIVSIASSIFWGLTNNMGKLGLPYYPLDLIIAVFCYAIYWFKYFFDVSKENQERADKLQRMDKQKDDFLANTSHELRNPLHAMLNIAQSSLENDKSVSREEHQHNLQLLITIGQRMSLLLNDLLDLPLLKANRIHLQMEKVNLSSIVSGVMDMQRFMTGDKNIEFILDIPDHFPSVIADENRLIQILFNFIHNAVKFTKEGKITVSAEIQKGMAVIHVKDTGIGMDEATMKRIFEPYEQGDTSMTAIGGGVGLGLSICKQFINLHRGSLWVTSTLGEGSTFSFNLPVADENDLREEERVSPIFTALEEVSMSALEFSEVSLNLEHPRVLVVDDDSMNLRILQRILSSEQYNVVTCTSGKEALSLLNKGNWDVVITDVMMPNMSGYELTQTIRTRYSISELPILLLTARSQWEDKYTGFQTGANDYVTKPVEKFELISRVRALTDLKYSINERVRMEAAWLQAQIQPHFLFNTLNTIASLSEVDPSKMIDLLNVFGNYLRASFDIRNLDKVVPLKHELELVHSYVYIEQERFKDRLTVEWEVDEGLFIQVPPLSIQTIVENAVKHGVLKRPHGGIIRIQIKEQLEFVGVMIADDGVGMTEDKLEQLLNNQSDHMRGIGLPNTDKRLKQLYGHGLVITSSLGQGTMVTFNIPKIPQTD